MFWGLIMEPNKRYTQEVEKSFHVSQAALDVSTSDGEPVQVMVTFEKRNYLIGTLQKGKNVQIPLDLNFETGNVISFTSNGNSHVHLTGYLVPDDPYDDIVDEDESCEEEEAPTLVPVKKDKRKASGSDGPSPKKTKAPELADLLNNTKDDDTSSEDDDFDPNNATGNTTNDSEDLEFDSDDVREELAEDDDDDDDDDDNDDEADDNEDGDDDDESEEVEEVFEEKPKSKKDKKSPKQNATPVQNGVESKKDKKKSSSTDSVKKVLSGGVSVEDLKVGSGQAAQSGKKVQVYYIGRLKSNNKVFDSTQKGPGFKFALGKGEVIKGWDIGVVGMKVGGKRKITIPPQMAYGAKGSPPVIPPNSTLVFEVELRNVH